MAPVPMGIFAGAGISVAPPAGLPMGDEFHDRLLSGCFAAARGFAPEAVTADGLRLLTTGGRRNILGCIEDCLPDGTTADVLDCMRVRLPAESHLLCAVHASRGVRVVTLNFDNGIELAHGLLTGAVPVPASAPPAYVEALREWRTALGDPGPLRVVSTPAQLARHAYPAGEPTLIKLRGSVDRGTDETVIPLRPALEDMESVRLDPDRFAALRVVAESGHLLVTGHSGRDLDCFESLRMVLRPGGFTWVVPEITPLVAARVAAIDPAQPTCGTAEEALRADLPPVPPWPRLAWPGSDFPRRFAGWWAGIPPAAAAEAYAWMLADAGRYEEPIAVLRALAPGRPAVRLRLAEVLIHRGRPPDLAEADRILTAALPHTPPALRPLLRARRAQARTALGPDALLPLLGAGDDRVWIRAVTILAALIRDRGAAEPALRRTLEALRTARTLADRLGTGARQTDLDLEILAAETELALLAAKPSPPDAEPRLSAIERAYSHRGNPVGLLRVCATRALAHLASGDTTRFTATVSTLETRATTEEHAHVAADLAKRLRDLPQRARLPINAH